MTDQKSTEQKAQDATLAKKQNILNLLVIAFVAVMTTVSLITFFIAICDENASSYYIVSLYVLCMLLAAPTLKVFLDKTTCPRMRLINWIGVIVIFVAILTMAVTVSIDMVC